MNHPVRPTTGVDEPASRPAVLLPLSAQLQEAAAQVVQDVADSGSPDASGPASGAPAPSAPAPGAPVTAAVPSVVVQALLDWPGPALAECRVQAWHLGDVLGWEARTVVVPAGTTLDGLAEAVAEAGYAHRRRPDGRAAWRVLPDHSGPWLTLDVEPAGQS